MTTKVRGAKGFDALFSRFFDEPELNAAVSSLHDNFSATDAEHPVETPAAPAAAKRAPAAAAAAKKQVVPPVAAPAARKKQVVAPAPARKHVVAPAAPVKAPVGHKAAAAKHETVSDERELEQSQDLDAAQLEQLDVLSSKLTSGWSIELLDQLADEMEIEPTEEPVPEEAVDQLPVITVDEPVLEDFVDEVLEAVEEPEAVADPVIAPEPEEIVIAAAPAAVESEEVAEPIALVDAPEPEEVAIPAAPVDVEPEEVVIATAPVVVEPEEVTAPVAPVVPEPEVAVIAAAPAVVEPEEVVIAAVPVDVEPEAVATAVAPAITMSEAFVIPDSPAPVVSEVVVTPVVHSVTIPEAVAAPAAVTPAAPVAPADSTDDDDDDDDDLLIEDFFSRKGKLPAFAPTPSHDTVHAPVIAPFVPHQPALVTTPAPSVKSAAVAAPAPVVTPTPVAASTPATAKGAPLPEKVTPPVGKSLSGLLVHPLPQFEDLSSLARRRPLSKDQGRILVYLFEIAEGCSNVEILSKDLAIDSHTVRESLLVLVTEGYLYLLDKKRDSRVNPAGFSYRMNNYLCSRYAARLRGSGELDEDLSIRRSERTATGAIPQPVIFSSSVAKEKGVPAVQKEKEKETPAAAADADAPVLSGTVAAYWEKEGLEEPLVQKWCDTFGVEAEQMHQQLEWARFDLETNKRRENVKKDMISWFYDRLMITGGIYPRPANYRSAEELRAEALQHQHESDLSAQAKIVEIEFENSLRAFLADPEAPLYQELLERVNSFALEQLKSGDGKAETIGLDALFKLHWGATANDPAASTVSFALSGLGAGQSDKPLSLTAGWNLVGYDAAYSQPVHQAVGSIAPLIESIWGWSSGQWLSYVPERAANSLTTLEPGMGYWIKMKQPSIWTLP